ncbi:MAG TPA: lipopolysaccharide kinase InaA family protein [Flavobacteriaceae bacterium]|nr:Kdo domain containing protein [Flavobacteriaceae bacterium]MCB9212399.1 Kdo domain containing protein [Alteromonas sp.]HQU20150.1 lipopolysaccharide kinase InaA family protein [Flavobacteriaceae bacterium]HQU64761.1 lipopolysaccharide kinase InaA family protein [Flavobacteriaceae bacterium]
MNKIVFTESFKDQQAAVMQVVENFDAEVGKDIGDGDRNTIKAFQLQGLHLNVKSFKIPNLVNKIVYRFFRKSKAERSFLNASKLLELGIGTPKPIAFAESHRGIFFGKSYYVSEQVAMDFTFRELIHNPKVPRREEIIRKFTHFTFKLHENGVLFKDHSPGNTLIKLDGEEVHFYLVDLNRMVFKPLSFEERILNFTRLSPLEDMVSLMSEVYAPLVGSSYEKVFHLMWSETEAFQKRFHRKRRLKKQLLFWRKK